ncbi:MAG: glycerophosphodiester phosphodiesterase family protein [Mangrovicoccus sp.]
MLSYRSLLGLAKPHPLIVAHRGAWHAAPENTAQAITAAAERGFEIVEIDIRRSADGVLFLLHDETLDRMTGITGRAEAFNWDELSQMTLRHGDGGSSAEMTTLCIPDLESALLAARNRVCLDLDVKSTRDLEDVAAMVARLGMTDQVDLKITVHTEAQAAERAALQDRFGVFVMPMTRFEADNADDRLDLLTRIRAPLVEAKFDQLSTLAERKAQFAEAGLRIWINSLDPVACDGLDDSGALRDPDRVWGQLVDAGISVIQTDEPEALDLWRQSRDIQQSTDPTRESAA